MDAEATEHTPADALARHRLSALAATLRFVQQHSPFYRELLAGRSIDENNARDVLAELPVFTADGWQRQRAGLRTGPPVGTVVGFTSGTTAVPRPYLSTAAERQAFAAASVSGGDEVVLNLVGLNHGLQPVDVYPATVLTIPLLDDGHFENAARILERRDEPYASMPPVTTVAGSLRMVKHLSLYLRRRHESLTHLGVSRLSVFRHLLSPTWRARLELWWGARVDTSYGSSELSACGFQQCGDCGHYHPAPSGLVEFVDPRDPSVPVGPGGRGTVVVTVFFPFIQLEPRLRYRPGDLVQIADQPCPRWGEFGFRVLGREQHAVWSPDAAGWVTPADCFEAVADLPEVAVSHDTPQSAADPRLHEAGSPRIALRADGGGVALDVELRYDPLVWPAEAERVRRTVHARMPVAGVAVHTHGQGQLPGPPCFI